ncbi:hypothetical protein EDD36DRAFT_326284 [Exophiala viscosa]|uniref:Secreted protein n=1 Tax=Exophiala viscosa TaxID=2486360 RepID=A0AAN6DPF0_9EURO|nr:hypothetical protein EDD36DRAFT_326284 [Exophiala viscosa]
MMLTLTRLACSLSIVLFADFMQTPAFHIYFVNLCLKILDERTSKRTQPIYLWRIDLWRCLGNNSHSSTARPGPAATSITNLLVAATTACLCMHLIVSRPSALTLEAFYRLSTQPLHYNKNLPEGL